MLDPRERPLEVGDRVRSIQVGRREAFDGVIVAIDYGVYDVRDEQGRLWRRNERELKRIRLN